MDCDIDRILSYILCYSATIDMKEATDYRFTGLIKELQDVLPADRWGGGETQGRINAILSYTFQNRNFSRHHRRRFNRAADGGRRILHRAQLTGGPLLTTGYHIDDQRLGSKRWDGGRGHYPGPDFMLCAAFPRLAFAPNAPAGP
jgi:hypothetical protein